MKLFPHEDSFFYFTTIITRYLKTHPGSPSHELIKILKQRYPDDEDLIDANYAKWYGFVIRMKLGI